MNLLFGNPVTLAYHYLLLWFYNGTQLGDLHVEFSKNDKAAEERTHTAESTNLEYDFVIGKFERIFCKLFVFKVFVKCSLVYHVWPFF